MSDYWDLLAWDDEDKADRPYIHIYSDEGAIACLYYQSAEERESDIEFAQRLVVLKSERDRLTADIQRLAILLDLSDDYVLDSTKTGELVRCSRTVETWREIKSIVEAER